MDATILRTALDSLDAKLSFSSLGYDPTVTRIIASNESESSFYADLLHLMAQALFHLQDSIDTDTINKTARRIIKRQTPLINAGYATRVAIITHMIKRFISQHQSGLNIVFLGCGFDVLGLWVQSLGTSYPIFTYEVDEFHNASKKGQALKYIAHSLLNEWANPIPNWDMTETEIIITDQDQSNSRIIFQGCISHGKHCDLEIKATNYTLFHADLRDISSIQQGFTETGIDVSLPTLVITELVLAYLGTQERTDQLLKYISQHLCICNTSMMLAYEPMGPLTLQLNLPCSSSSSSSSSSSNTIISVLDGYTTQYFQRFSDKLDRNSNQNPFDDIHHDVQRHRFQSIGPNPTFIRNRLRACGFDGLVDCCCAGKAAALLPVNLISHDIFDEYMALYMHLSCYAVLCACSSYDTVTISTFKNICPWSVVPYQAYKGIGLQKNQYIAFKSSSQIPNIPSTEFYISIIQAQNEETQVRMQFESTYAHLFDTFPSVKKMVKNALKTDLSSQRGTNIICGKNPLQIQCSHIQEYYMNQDGAFWVATVNLTENYGEVVNDDTRQQRRVIGFIGLRRAGSVNIHDNINTNIQRYEITRLVVCAQWRNQGVGRALVKTVQDFVRDRLDTTMNKKAIIMATTPSILDKANALYSSLGFHVVGEVTQNGLLMKTYHCLVNERDAMNTGDS